MTNGEFFPATIAMTVCFLDSAAPGPLFGEGQVVRYGNGIAFLEGRLSNSSGRLVARATANARMVPAKRAVA
jgi:acyl-coenzyme A thioesterase PaaI-like protein